MSDAERFKGLKKIPDTPFEALAKIARINLKPDLEINPKKPTAEVLQALEDKNAVLEFLQVVAHALPPRERVWLACLSATDLLPNGSEKTPAMKAAEAWVYKPNTETRAAVQKTIDNSAMDDETVLVADAAFHAIIPGMEEEIVSPPNASGTMVFAVLMKALFSVKGAEAQKVQAKLLADRALDIARGGNGRTAQQNGAAGGVVDAS
jgi:Family of unknown function (DUF6931)